MSLIIFLSKNFIKPNSDVVFRFTHRYGQFNPGPVFKVTLEHNKLYGQVGHDKKELVPFAKHKFFARDLDASLIFQIDSKNKIIGLNKIQNSEMKAHKL